MGRAEDIAELEAQVPWLRADFRADLAALAGSTAAASRRFADDARMLARMAAAVPRCPGDERGGTPWTSFRREVAVARKTSDQAAGVELRAALRLTTVLRRTMALLDGGTMPVHRAQTLVAELEVYDDQLAGALDAELADQAALLPAWRIRQAVRRAALRADPDSAALREASSTARRDVALHSQDDGQACVSLTGPAVPLTRWYATLDERARALRAAGDPRTLDNLRFDLAVAAFPCSSHSTADTSSTDTSSTCSRRPEATRPTSKAEADFRPSGVEAAPIDCRMSRPVQAHIVVPVETALGLSNDPAWLDGYGWISAPTSRQLLVDAELRRLCAQTGTGLPVDVDSNDRRPPPTPEGLRSALLDLVRGDDGRVPLGDVGWRTEAEHDPSDRLRDHVVLRDRHCDGPTGSSTPADRCDLDHTDPYPQGPTAAWNLAARSRRTHQLKHYGWTPIRTTTGTVWTSPSGQVVEMLRTTTVPPGVDTDRAQAPTLPSARLLADTDADQLGAPSDDDLPPWPEASDATDDSQWTWLHEPLPRVEDPPPF